MRRFIGLLVRSVRFYGHDTLQFLEKVFSKDERDAGTRLLSRMSARTHVIEKGLTMPEMRPNFGEDNVRALVHDCEACIASGLSRHFVLRNAIGVLEEYERIHSEIEKAVPSDLHSDIRALAARHPEIAPVHQVAIRKQDLFARGDFARTARTRHSIRTYSGPVDETSLRSALELAATAPSSCNRQSVRIHVVGRGTIFDGILASHRGNRGFGPHADKLILVASDRAVYTEPAERNAVFVDGGIYAMNLLYCLHYYGIAACTLNCFFTPTEERKVSALLNTKDVPVALIAIGDCPDEVKLARSARVPWDEHVVWHS
jgi:nitroreductase